MAPLAGKIALVTGAGRGIGRAAALELCRLGAETALAVRRPEAAQETIAASGGRAFAIACDVRDGPRVEAVIAEIEARCGGLDLVINNAGVITPIALLGEGDPAAWRALIETNLIGAYHVLRYAIPALVRRGGGTIVNLSSGAAHSPFEGWSAYCASKAALAMLTQMAHAEYGQAGVRCMGFGPGVVDTDMQGEIRRSGINRVSQLPQTSLAPAEGPARAIAWLCTPAAEAWAGREISLRDPAFRAAAGLSA